MNNFSGNYLNDMLAQAQDGQAADNLARLYGITPGQAQQAIDAVLPAFELGLERSAQSQAGMIGLLGTMARNPYAQAYDNTGLGFSPQIREQGNDALAAMFGSPDVSRAVAAQAAANTGLSSALIKQMLPAIAAMVLGGLMKGGSSGASNPLQDLLGGLLGGGAPRGGSAGAGSGNPLQDLLGGILGGAMGGGGLGGGTDRPSPRSGGADAGGGARNPLEDLLGGMFGGGAGVPSQRSPDDGASRGSNPLDDLLGGMFGGGGSGSGVDGGREAPTGGARSQDPKLQPFQDIFDQFFDPKTGGRR